MLCDWSEGHMQKFSQFWPKKKKKQPKTWHKLVTAQPSNNNIVHMVLSIFLIKLDFTVFFVSFLVNTFCSQAIWK